VGYIQDIVSVVGEELGSKWMVMKPDIYYLNNAPHGLIAKEKHHGVTYLMCTASDPEVMFTRGMIRDIMRIMKTEHICIPSEHKPSWDRLKKSLKPLGFIFKEHSDILWLYHFNIKEDDLDV